MSPFPLFTVGCGVILLSVFSIGPEKTQPTSVQLTTQSATSTTSSEFAVADNRYVGQKVCKNCHSGDDKGNIHEKWAESKHAKAFEVLGTEEAKKVGKEHGVDDPQKSDKCIQCHVTAFGVDEKEIKRGFKAEDGVQCETCHGPGENHFKKRFKESQGGGEPSPVTEDEIIAKRDPAICLKCHNDKSPTAKEFCFKESMMVIEHLDPRIEHSEEELAEARAICAPDCPKCSKEKKEGDEEKK